MLAASFQFVFKQIAQQLHGHVFECQGRAVGQSQNMQVTVYISQWRDQRIAEHLSGIGFAANHQQIFSRNIVYVQGQYFKSQISISLGGKGITQALSELQIDLGIGGRKIKTAIRS